MANEIDELEKFLKLAPNENAPVVTSTAAIKLGNGDTSHNEAVSNQESNENNEGSGDVAVNGEESNVNNEVDSKVENKNEEQSNGDAVPETKDKEEQIENDEAEESKEEPNED